MKQDFFAFKEVHFDYLFNYSTKLILVKKKKMFNIDILVKKKQWSYFIYFLIWCRLIIKHLIPGMDFCNASMAFSFVILCSSLFTEYLKNILQCGAIIKDYSYSRILWNLVKYNKSIDRISYITVYDWFGSFSYIFLLIERFSYSTC